MESSLLFNFSAYIRQSISLELDCVLQNFALVVQFVDDLFTVIAGENWEGRSKPGFKNM